MLFLFVTSVSGKEALGTRILILCSWHILFILARLFENLASCVMALGLLRARPALWTYQGQPDAPPGLVFNTYLLSK